MNKERGKNNSNSLEKIFSVGKPVIGMLHLDYLEGEEFKGINNVVQKALKDIEALQGGGIDGILIENWKEFSTGEFVSAETAKNFTQVVVRLSKYIEVLFGINVLNNDYKVAFSVAAATGASFVELDVFVDRVRSDFQNNQNAIDNPFVIDPNPREIMDYKKNIGADDISLFVFVQPKHYIMLEKDKTIEKSTQQAIEKGASGILVTKATGFAPTLDLIKRAKSVAGDIPVGIGSGFSVENAEEYLSVADFAIVGTSIKVDGVTDNSVDLERTKRLMKTVSKIRES